MFHLNVWDSFLVVYVVTVGTWLTVRNVQARRSEKKANLEGRVNALQDSVKSLSGELQRLSSPPPPSPGMSSPVLVIPRHDSVPAVPISNDDPMWAEEPTNPRMPRVEIVDDSGELDVSPSTLRSRAFAPAAE